jgi:hypothetical protein
MKVAVLEATSQLSRLVKEAMEALLLAPPTLTFHPHSEYTPAWEVER